MSFTRSRILPVCAAAAAASSALAAPAGKAPAAGSVTSAQAVTQVDGITSRVVDKLWEATDHYWHEGDYNRIVALTRVCVEADPQFMEAWGSGAWLLWSMGDTAGADAFLEEGQSRNPGVYDLYYEFGWHLFNTKRYAQALPHLEAAAEFPNAPAQVWKTLAHCYHKLGRLDDAERIWKVVVDKFPTDAVGPRNLREIRDEKRAREGPKP